MPIVGCICQNGAKLNSIIDVAIVFSGEQVQVQMLAQVYNARQSIHISFINITKHIGTARKVHETFCMRSAVPEASIKGRDK